ncbi:MAG: hypothetical protein Q9228_005626 [Teloschistes exilis]
MQNLTFLYYAPRPYALNILRWLYPLAVPNQPTYTLRDGQDPAGEDATATFPFEKLPEELRLRVLEFTLPENGYRPLPAEWDTPHQDYIDYVRKSDFVTENLMLANKWISTEMRNLIRKRATQYIIFTCAKVRFLDQKLVLADTFHSHLTYARLPFFREMQHYYLDLDLGKIQSIRQIYNRRRFQLSFQEHVPTLADALSLTIAIPCRCHVENSEASVPVDPTCTKISTFLAPLKRIRVRDPVQFIAYTGVGRRESRVQCQRFKCLRLAQTMMAELGQLRGERLIEAEEKWKWRKTLLHLQEEKDCLVAYCRDHRNWEHVSFEEMVESVEGHFEQGCNDQPWWKGVNRVQARGRTMLDLELGCSNHESAGGRNTGLGSRRCIKRPE